MIMPFKRFPQILFKKENFIYTLSIILFLGYACYYLGGLASVPFHPDESTQIYMSDDIDTMLHHFSELFWQPGKTGSLKQHYHELDAPVTRYMIGLGRLIEAQPPLLNDWDWSKTWDQNRAAGALPDASLLWVARFSVACLTLFSLLFLFDLVQLAFNPYTALVAAALFATNPLVLLHTRRAMAESALLFFIILFVWSLLRFPLKSILGGAVLALAFCAKQTAGLLLIPALFTTIAFSVRSKSYSQMLLRITNFLLAFLVVTFLMNPFVWTDPVHSISSALLDRQDLTARQQNTISSANPEKAINTLPSQLAAVIGAVYFQPLAVADVANYLESTSAAEKIYLSNPLNRLLHDAVSSSLLFILAFVGLIFAFISLFRRPETFKKIFILILSFACILVGLICFVPIPFQRYYLPLLPFLSIWVSVALTVPLVNRGKAQG